MPGRFGIEEALASLESGERAELIEFLQKTGLTADSPVALQKALDASFQIKSMGNRTLQN